MFFPKLFNHGNLRSVKVEEGKVTFEGVYGKETFEGGGDGFNDFAIRIDVSFPNPAVGQSEIVNSFSSSILKGDVTKWTNGAYCNVYLQIWNSSELRFYDVSGVGEVNNNYINFTAIANPFTNTNTYTERSKYIVRARIRFNSNGAAAGQLIFDRLI